MANNELVSITRRDLQDLCSYIPDSCPALHERMRKAFAAAPAHGGLSDALPVEWHARTNDMSDAGCMAAMKAEIADLRAALRGQVSDAADAARWRAVVASARIKPQGSAGLESPQPGNYAHMGLEMWTTHDRDYSASLLEQMDRQNALGRKWLTAYADVAVAAIQAQAGDAP